MKEQKSKAGKQGIRLNQLNIIFIIVGLAIATMMVVGMYQTSDSFQQVIEVTEAYLSSQQTSGMLKELAEQMSVQCAAFVSAESANEAMQAVQRYAGQMGELRIQLDGDAAYDGETYKEDDYLTAAFGAFSIVSDTQLHAMRLKADTLPVALQAFPAIIQNVALTPKEETMTPDEKIAAAEALIVSEEYKACLNTISAAVDDSHKTSSQRGIKRADQTAQDIRKIINRQKNMVFLFVAIAVAALLFNRFLIIRPIQKSVKNLDQHEPIPIQGSYEVRHLANVYNEVLKDNQMKTDALSFTATHDALTGVYNRAAFDDAYAQYKDEQIGIVVTDVDYFKHYNDEYGHDVGDRVLRVVADKLGEHFRSKDIISRIGGDEFCIILPDTMHAQGKAIARKIQAINEELAESGNDLPPITISAGVAYWNRPNADGSIFKDADNMLLEVKKRRTECCLVYPGPGENEAGT